MQPHNPDNGSGQGEPANSQPFPPQQSPSNNTWNTSGGYTENSGSATANDSGAQPTYGAQSSSGAQAGYGSQAGFGAQSSYGQSGLAGQPGHSDSAGAAGGYGGYGQPGGFGPQGGYGNTAAPGNFGQPGAPGAYGTATPSKPSKMPAWGKGLTAVGAVLLLLAIGLGIWAGIRTADAAQDFSASEVVGSNQIISLDLTAGEERTVWAESASARCSINGGALERPTTSETFSANEKTYDRVGHFVADTDGNYTVTCNAPFTVNSFNSVGGFIGGAFGLVAAIMLGMLALLLVVIGAILWAVGANKNKKRAMQ